MSNWNKTNRPDNVLEISPTEQNKYKKLKEGEDIKPDDCINIFDDYFVMVTKGNKLCKEKVNKYNTILRKK